MITVDDSCKNDDVDEDGDQIMTLMMMILTVLMMRRTTMMMIITIIIIMAAMMMTMTTTMIMMNTMVLQIHWSMKQQSTVCSRKLLLDTKQPSTRYKSSDQHHQISK